MDEISDELSLTYGEGAYSDSKRQKARMGRMRKVLQSTARAVARQLSGGDFDLQGAEIRFGKNGSYPSIELKEADGTLYEIHGIIDRADKDKEGLIRVVDYKSGGKDFKFAKLYEGIDLQLPMYLAAAIAGQPGSEPSGFYYMPVKNPCVDEKDEAKLIKKLSDSMRLTGLTAGGSDTDSSVMKPTVVTPEQMKAVLGFALSKAAETLGKIREGDVSARPFRSGNESACRICEFKDACGFDVRNPRCGHRVFKTLKQNEFFERLAPARLKGENHD
jgi:ATP-dependent helicase/nuclease subunit B